jgi:hypothetical protein
MDFEQLYQEACARDTDIHEHLPLLAQLASECTHVTELGVGHGQSTIGFLRNNIELHSYEYKPFDYIPKLFEDYRNAGRNVTLHIADTREINIAPTDFLFIDSLHIYEQVKIELHLHANKAKKYIGFHDTTTYATNGEFGGRGIWPAIQEFLDEHPEWQLIQRRINNNGLTILKRV